MVPLGQGQERHRRHPLAVQQVRPHLIAEQHKQVHCQSDLQMPLYTQDAFSEEQRGNLPSMGHWQHRAHAAGQMYASQDPASRSNQIWQRQAELSIPENEQGSCISLLLCILWKSSQAHPANAVIACLVSVFVIGLRSLCNL